MEIDTAGKGRQLLEAKASALQVQRTELYQPSASLEVRRPWASDETRALAHVLDFSLSKGLN